MAKKMTKHQQVNEKMTIVLNELMGKKTKMPMAEVRQTLLRMGKNKTNSVAELDRVYAQHWTGRPGYMEYWPNDWKVYDWTDRFSRWIENNPEYNLVRERVGKANRNWIVRK